MIAWFRPWMIWALAVAALGVMLGVQTLRLSEEKRAHEETRLQYANETAQREEAARKAVEDAREEEQRRTAAAQEIANDTQKKLDVARADADAARTAGERLRGRIAELTTALSVGPGKNTATAAPGAPTQSTAALLADVQQRLGDAEDAIAGYADRARAAGAACERTYDSLTTGH